MFCYFVPRYLYFATLWNQLIMYFIPLSTLHEIIIKCLFLKFLLLIILNFCRDLSSFFLFENLRLFQSAGLLAWWWQFWNNPMKAIAEWVCSAGGLRNKMFIAHPHLKAYTYLVTILMINITTIQFAYTSTRLPICRCICRTAG